MIETAKKAALAAGEIIMQHFRKVPPEAIRSKQKNDFLSFVDEQSEQAIISTIRNAFPDHAFLAEESGASQNSDAHLWIIDPLDGTTNYITGLPVFAVSIALQFKGELILGVIYDPLHEEMFWAEKGKGAFLNDQPIHVTQKARLDQSLIATGFPFKAKHFLDTYLAAFKDVFQSSVGMRRMGAAAIDLAYVAAGRFDGFWEIGLSPWDIAAGAILIREAGGRISDFWDNDDFLHKHYTLASNGRIHRELMAKITKHFKSFKPVYQTKGE